MKFSSLLLRACEQSEILMLEWERVLSEATTQATWNEALRHYKRYQDILHYLVERELREFNGPQKPTAKIYKLSDYLH